MMKRYKILHFALGFIPVYGGNTTRIFNLISDNFHDHYLYVPSSPSIFVPKDMQVDPGEEDMGKIHVRRIKLGNFPKNRFPILDYLLYFKYLSRNAKLLCHSVKEKKIDFIYGHSPLEFSMPSLMFAKKNNLPLIYEAHSIKCDNLWRSTHPIFRYYHHIMQFFIIKKERSVIQDANFIIAQTQMSKHRISRLYDINEDKIIVVHNGVDIEKFNPDKYKSMVQALRKEKKWDQKHVVMYCGLLDKTNGISFLLDCIKKIPKKLQERIKIVFIGRGEMKDRIVALSKEIPLVEYLGLMSHDKIPLYIAACDLFCIPRPSSLAAETLIPMKLLEAMAMKRLVLVSDVGGMTKVVQDGRNGFVFPPGNALAFIKKLEQIVQQQSEDSSIMKEIAHEDIITGYTWDRARKSLQDIYYKACMR